MKLKSALIITIIGAFFASCFALIADPLNGIEEGRAQETFEFHPDEVHVEVTEEAFTGENSSGPEVVEYYEYKEDKTYKPGILSGEYDFGKIGKGLFYDGQDFYYFTDTGIMASNYMRTIEGDRFFFGEDGKMVKNQLVNYDDELYFFDINGAMYKNRWHTEEEIDEADKTITYTDYYFGPTGRAYRAGDSGNNLIVKTIDGEKFGFNSDGEKLEGYYSYDGTEFDPAEDPAYVGCTYYFDPKEFGAATVGWHYYEGSTRSSEYSDDEELVMYFDPKTARKVEAKSNDLDRCVSRIIDGERYMFDKNGIRRNKWYKSEGGRATDSNVKYFSDEYDGYLQKGWFTAVPGAYSKKGADLILDVNKKRHDEEEEMWFYAGSNGNILRKCIRKIGSYIYAFDDDGVMQQNAMVKVRNGEFIKAYDCDYISKFNILNDPNEYGNAEEGRTVTSNPIDLPKEKGLLDIEAGERWMYFLGENFGEVKIGSQAKQNSAVRVEFLDDVIDFYGNGIGGYCKTISVPISSSENKYITAPVERNSKYIQNGVILKPNPDDNNYGLIRLNPIKEEFEGNNNRGAMAIINYKNRAVPSDNRYVYFVANGSGERVKATNKSFKTKQGDWLWVGQNGEFLGSYSMKGEFVPNADEAIYVDENGEKVDSASAANYDYTIMPGQAYWKYKKDGAKVYSYGMPSKASRIKVNDLALNYSAGSSISLESEGDVGPYVDGLASFMYKDYD